MNKQYIDVPIYTTFNDINAKNFSLSATQHKKFCINNKNVKSLADLLDRKLEGKDLGVEVGSDNYVDNSNYKFAKTKALQETSFLLDENKEAMENISPKCFVDMKLLRGDILISKDSNVGEIAIADKNYPNVMLSSGVYRLPLTKNKYYVLAMIKSGLFRQQIDFMIPRGSTIRHGKTKFLDCLIPFPNKNIDNTILYIESLTKAIIEKEIVIRRKHKLVLEKIQEELLENQKDNVFSFSYPCFNEIKTLMRLDSSLYSKNFKENQFIVENYKYGFDTLEELNFEISRGQNLQVSNIGQSIYSDEEHEGFYKLVRPTNISEYGVVNQYEFLGNKNDLSCLKTGDLIFGAEGTFRSFVCVENAEKIITNIHGIVLRQCEKEDFEKGIFVKLVLDYFKAKEMLQAFAVGGNGGSLAIKYLNYLKIPRFSPKKQQEITTLYFNNIKYNASSCTIDNFLKYDSAFNEVAGIYEIDKSKKFLEQKLRKAIENIADDVSVMIEF